MTPLAFVHRRAAEGAGSEPLVTLKTAVQSKPPLMPARLTSCPKEAKALP